MRRGKPCVDPVTGDAPSEWAWKVGLVCVELGLLTGLIVFEGLVGPTLRATSFGDTPRKYALVIPGIGVIAYLLVVLAYCRFGSIRSPRRDLRWDMSFIFERAVPLWRMLLLVFAPLILVPAFTGCWWILGFVWWVLGAGAAAEKKWKRFIARRGVAGAMDDARLEDLRDLARKRGVKKLNIVVLSENDSDACEVYSLSLRGVLRVALGEGMLKMLSPAELRGVFAHELAHHELKHTRRTISVMISGELLAILGMAYWVLALQYANYLPRSLGVFIPSAVLVWYLVRLILVPLINRYLRRSELKADRLAVKITRDPAAFVSAYTKLAKHKAPDTRSSRLVHWLFDDAPSLRERLGAIEK